MLKFARQGWYIDMKKGFSLLLAIAFIIVVMTLGAFSLRFATFTSQVNSDTYLKLSLIHISEPTRPY